MDRRKYLKFLGVGSIATSTLLWESCASTSETDAPKAETEILETGREAHEIAHDKKLLSETFFTEHEMATIAVLADIIIPKDEKSGSATDAGVPAFIEFIVKDMPHHQLPMRGGLKWLDHHSLQRFGHPFQVLSQKDQLAIIDDIAYPNKVPAGMEQGAAFFNKMRDLTATGFYTSEIGIADLEYMGNRPDPWDGPSAEELKAHGFG